MHYLSSWRCQWVSTSIFETHSKNGHIPLFLKGFVSNIWIHRWDEGWLINTQITAHFYLYVNWHPPRFSQWILRLHWTRSTASHPPYIRCRQRCSGKYNMKVKEWKNEPEWMCNHQYKTTQLHKYKLTKEHYFIGLQLMIIFIIRYPLHYLFIDHLVYKMSTKKVKVYKHTISQFCLTNCPKKEAAEQALHALTYYHLDIANM